MNRTKLAWTWAAAILASAIASSAGLIPEGTAQGLYMGLMVGAVASLSQARCGSC